jgi:membrane-bound lytic murein transglycosylase B
MTKVRHVTSIAIALAFAVAAAPAAGAAERVDRAAVVDKATRPAVDAFINAMVAKHGFDRQQLVDLFAQVKKLDQVIELVKPGPPGKPRDWQRYRSGALTPVRVEAGAAFWNEHADALARAEAQYGVPAEIIVGIIGVETVYGRITGTFRTIDALATLAFDYPTAPNRSARMRFFRSELESALLYSSEARIDPLTIKGSYAGAVGLPQFMPSNIRRYAVDFDSDGRVDLRASPVDAIGSVANFLAEHGWARNLSVGAPAHSTAPDAAYAAAIAYQGLRAAFTLKQLQYAGIVAATALPDVPLGLINLPSPSAATQYFLGTSNFFAITKYNRSFFYAMSVIELGRAVSQIRLEANARGTPAIVLKPVL